MYYTVNEATVTKKTSITANQGYYAGTILVLWSGFTASGDSTRSAIFMLRCGYDGNHLTTTKIVENGTVGQLPTFTVSSDGYIEITSSITGYSLFIVNKGVN